MPLKRKKKFILALQPHEASPPTHAAWSPLKSRSLSLGVALFLLMGFAFSTSFTIPTSQMQYKASTLTSVDSISEHQLWADITPTGTWHYYSFKDTGDAVKSAPAITAVGFTRKDSQIIKGTLKTADVTTYFNTTTCEKQKDDCKDEVRKDCTIDEEGTETCKETTETSCTPKPDICTTKEESTTTSMTTFTQDEKGTDKLLAVKTNNWESGKFNPDVSACGALNTSNTVYTMNASAAINGSTCFTVTAANVTLDCAGFSVTGNNSTATYGIYSNQFNTTIKNCNISNFSNAIVLSAATFGTIQNVTGATTFSAGKCMYISYGSNNTRMVNSNFTSHFGSGIETGESKNIEIINSVGTATSTFSGTGFRFYLTSNITILNSSASAVADHAMRSQSMSNSLIANSTFTTTTTSASIYVMSFENPSANNTIINNTLLKTTAGSLVNIVATRCGNNTFYLNNFTATTGTYVTDLNGSNFYNATYNGINQGNIYANVINGSVVINSTGTNSSISGYLVGTGGSGYPYNNTTSVGKFSCNFAGCADYAPLILAPAPPSPVNFTVNYTAGGTATGSNNTATPPANLTINATTSAGYSFVNWTENCNGTVNNATNPNTYITVSDATSCFAQANFVENAPIIQTSTITPTVAYQYNSLLGYCNATTGATTVTYNYTWYLNGAANTSGSVGAFTQGVNTNVANVSSASIAVGQIWILQCRAYNAKGASAFLNSSAKTIMNTTPNITAISISPASPTIVSNLSCTVTAVDIEHATTNITGNWSKNGVVLLAFSYNNLANNTATVVATLNSGNFSKNDNISCSATAFDGIYYSPLTTSANKTILNSAPTSPMVNNFVNATIGHSFTVNGSVTDADGGTDIATATITPSIGSCTQLSNSTSGTTFNVKYNCTSTAPGTANIMIGFTDKSSAYANNSSSNAYPNNAPTTSITSITNATTSHSFTYNTTITDLDGLADQSYNLTSTLGTCIQLSNTTNTTSITLAMSCTSTTPGTTTITTNSTDLFNANNYTTSSNAYPDHAASMTAPTITPTTLFNTTTATCNMGVFSDIDGDTENVTARTYAWQYNGGATGITTATFDLNAFGANNSANVSCSIMATNSTWATSNATTYSANKTITPNYAPNIVIQNTFTNSTTGHSFTVFAGANDTDAGDSIAFTNITTTFGTCVYVSNTTSGGAMNVTYLCTATSSGTTNITVRFTDTIAGAYNTTTSSNNTYPDHAPTLTAPTITPALAHLNDTLTCNPGTFADVDGDTENVSARIWAWYVNGVYTAATATLPSGAFTTYDNITCTQNSTNSSWTLTVLASSAVFTNILSFFYTTYGNTSNVTGFGAAFDYSKTVMATATGSNDAFGLMILAMVFIGFYIIGSKYTQERALTYSAFMTLIIAFLLVSGNFLDVKYLILIIIAFLAMIYFSGRVS